MKFYKILLLNTILIFILSDLAQAQTITIDETIKYQTIEGWGTCSSQELLATDPTAQKAYKDLGCNIYRVSFPPNVLIAPGGDLSGPEVDLGSDLDANIAKFDFEIGTWGMQYNDDIVQWLSENALEPERVKITGSLWSPPHWAKEATGASTESVCGDAETATPYIGCNGNDAIGGTWAADHFQYNARFIAALVQGFEQHAEVPLYSFSIQNEAGFENPFSSCTLFQRADENGKTVTDYTQYAKALKAVKDEFALHSEIDTKIMGPHNANILSEPSNPWGMNWQMEAIQAVKDHSDPELIDFLKIYTHNYGAGAAKRAEMFKGYWDGSDAVSEETWADWAFAPGIADDGKQTWNSEFGGHGTDWNGALDLALDMQTQLAYGHESAMIYWTFANETVDMHSLLGSDQLSDPEQSKKYSAFKHFSRYIRPGAKRVKATFEDGNMTFEGNSALDTENALNVSAYVHETDGTITIVLVNMKDKSYDNVVINLPSSFSDTTYQIIQTDADKSFEVMGSVTPESDQITISVSPSSVVTITEGSNITGLNYDQSGLIDRATISPNPSSGAFQLYTKASMQEVEILHVTGQQVAWQQENINKRTLAFGENLKPGIYLVKIMYYDGNSETLKIMKE